MRVDDFALVRGATEPITSKQTAERVWEPRFLKGRLKAVRGVLGDLPVSVLERPEEIQRFKAAYRQGHEIATVNRALSTLRGAINWGRFQDPPLLTNSPFHRFGITIRTKEETTRDRRIGPEEEKALLDAALAINSDEHKWAGASMHDRIIGALETCCRQGEMLRIQNRHVDWERHQIAIPGAHAKDAENRRVPFDPQGRLAPVLMRRAKLGASAFVFGGPEGEYQDSFKTAWESLLLGSPRASVWGSSRGFAPRLRKRARQDSNLRPSA
jgi:integrase